MTRSHAVAGEGIPFFPPTRLSAKEQESPVTCLMLR